MKEAQRVRLQNLRVIGQPPLFLRRRWNLHPQHRVPGFGTRQHVAHRTNAADPRHQPRHLVKRPALAHLLEAAKLRHMEFRRFHPPRLVELNRDLGVPLDPRHRLNDHGPAHDPNLAAFPGLARPASASIANSKMAFAEGGQPGRKQSTATTSCTRRTRSRSFGTIPFPPGKPATTSHSRYARPSTSSTRNRFRIAVTFPVTAQSPKAARIRVRSRIFNRSRK